MSARPDRIPEIIGAGPEIIGAGARTPKPSHNAAHQALCRAVRDYVEAIGGWHMKVWGGPLQKSGVPDCLCCVRGVLIAVEVKTGAGRLSAAQEAEREALQRAGAVYVLCRRIEDLEDALLAAGLIARRMLNR